MLPDLFSLLCVYYDWCVGGSQCVPLSASTTVYYEASFLHFTNVHRKCVLLMDFFVSSFNTELVKLQLLLGFLIQQRQDPQLSRHGRKVLFYNIRMWKTKYSQTDEEDKMECWNFDPFWKEIKKKPLIKDNTALVVLMISVMKNDADSDRLPCFPLLAANVQFLTTWASLLQRGSCGWQLSFPTSLRQPLDLNWGQMSSVCPCVCKMVPTRTPDEASTFSAWVTVWYTNTQNTTWEEKPQFPGPSCPAGTAALNPLKYLLALEIKEPQIIPYCQSTPSYKVRHIQNKNNQKRFKRTVFIHLITHSFIFKSHFIQRRVTQY